ncbi:jg2729, partial [Pararge aegeria aegeria]
MSSYGSTSPSDEGFDRYEPPFYCQPSHQGSPMDGGVYWPAVSGEGHEFDAQDIYHDTSNYIGRNY